MNSQALSSWIQAIGAIAILGGLGLVVWELQQAREIAKAQQASDGSAGYSQRVQAMMGENAARAVAKACDEPDSLTTEDMFVLDHFYTEVLNNMRWSFLVDEAAADLMVADWHRWTVNFYLIFGTEYGRWWWQMSEWEPEIMEAGNRFLAEQDIPSCSERYDLYRNRKQSSLH